MIFPTAVSILLGMVIGFISPAAFRGESTQLTGIVVDSSTREPLSKITVTLVRVGSHSPEVFSATTSSEGRFEIGDLPEGDYEIKAKKNGYVVYDPQENIISEPPLHLGGTNSSKTIQIPMIRTGAISGSVYDSDGVPTQNAPVFAFKLGHTGTAQEWIPIQEVATDGRGNFRLFWLPPGLYRVMAMAHGPITKGSSQAEKRVFISDPATSSQLQSVSIPDTFSSDLEIPGTVFYPNSIEMEQGKIIQIPPGGLIDQVQITLSSVPTRQVSGTISSGDAEAGQYSLSVVSRMKGDVREIGVGSKGVFNFRLPRGHYWLVAVQDPSSLDVKDFASFAQKRLSAVMPIEVGAQDLDNIRIVIKRPIPIRGKIQIKSFQSDTRAIALDGLKVSLDDRSIDLVNGLLRVSSTVQKDGSFILYAPEWEYELSVLLDTELGSTISSALKRDNLFIKSMRLGDEDISEGHLMVSAAMGNTPLLIELGDQPATLAGHSVASDGVLRPHSAVLLIPENRLRRRADLYRTMMSDESGQFNFADIAPGTYSLIAVDQIEDGAWFNDDLIRRYELSGQTKAVHFAENDRERIDIVVQ